MQLGDFFSPMPIMELLATRTQTKLYPEFGIDSPLDELLGGNVPSNRDVIRHYFFHHKTKMLSARESYDTTADGVLARWKGSKVPLRCQFSVSEQIRSLIEELR